MMSLIMTRATVVLLTIIGLSCSVASALSMSQHLDRRSAIAASISMPFLLVSDSASSSSFDSSSSPSIIANPNPRAITTIRIDSPGRSVGLELYTVQIGTPRRNVVAVLSARMGGEGAKAGAQRGMILMDYANIEDVLKQISDGPYPIEIRLYNLALGGDAVGDLGRSIVSPDDALELAERVSSSSSSSSSNFGDNAKNTNGLMINVIRKARGECSIKSRRGDTMQIRYDARIGDRNGETYDSSDFRGTGQPYAYVLGNSDVLKGVDLGTYDMCPGEVRELTIPPVLGYPNGSKLFKQIPPNSELFWRVELVELNFVNEENNDAPRDARY